MWSGQRERNEKRQNQIKEAKKTIHNVNACVVHVEIIVIISLL